jgi:hypothetical protein
VAAIVRLLAVSRERLATFTDSACRGATQASVGPAHSLDAACCGAAHAETISAQKPNTPRAIVMNASSLDKNVSASRNIPTRTVRLVVSGGSRWFQKIDRPEFA